MTLHVLYERDEICDVTLHVLYERDEICDVTSEKYNAPLCSILCVLQPLWARHGQKLQRKRAWRNFNVGSGPPLMACPLYSRAGRYVHEAILFMARLVGAILYTKATLTFMVMWGREYRVQ